VSSAAQGCFPMNPVSAAANKIAALRYQLDGQRDAAAIVVMKDGILSAGVPLRSQPDQQQLRFHLHNLGLELSACLDDILHNDRRAAALKLDDVVGPEPITVKRLTNALDAAEIALKSVASERQAPPLDGGYVAKLESLVDAVNKAVAAKGTNPFGYEVLAAPPRNAGKADLKVKATQQLPSSERSAKRRGLHEYATKLAAEIGREILPDLKDRDRPQHRTLMDALDAFARLGADGNAVSAKQFAGAAQDVMKGVNQSLTQKPYTKFYDPADPKDKGATFKSVKATDLYRHLFEDEAMKATPIVQSVSFSLDGLGAHFSRKRVLDDMKHYGIAPSEALAVWLYTVESGALNTHSREAASFAYDRPKEVPGAKAINQLLAATLPKLPQPVASVLHRGLNPSGMLKSKLKQLTTPGSIFVDEAHSSSSHTQPFGYPMSITIVPCDKSAGRAIMNLSARPDEGEILYPPYTRFKVLSSELFLPDGTGPIKELDEETWLKIKEFDDKDWEKTRWSVAVAELPES